MDKVECRKLLGIIFLGSSIVSLVLATVGQIFSVLFDMPILAAAYVISIATLLLSPCLYYDKKILKKVLLISAIAFLISMNLMHRSADGTFHLWPY